MDIFNSWEFVTISLLALGILGWFWRLSHRPRWNHVKHYHPRRYHPRRYHPRRHYHPLHHRRTNRHLNDRETVNLWADIVMGVMDWWSQHSE